MARNRFALVLLRTRSLFGGDAQQDISGRQRTGGPIVAGTKTFKSDCNCTPRVKNHQLGQSVRRPFQHFISSRKEFDRFTRISPSSAPINIYMSQGGVAIKPLQEFWQRLLHQATCPWCISTRTARRHPGRQ